MQYNIKHNLTFITNSVYFVFVLPVLVMLMIFQKTKKNKNKTINKSNVIQQL